MECLDETENKKKERIGHRAFPNFVFAKLN